MIYKLKKAFSFLWESEGFENKPSNNTFHEAKFVLSYQSLDLGILTYDSPIWTFQYSNEFKEQNKLSVLIDFPDKNITYQSDELWPFFLSRIPSSNQRAVKEFINKSGNSFDLIGLLGAFGKKTIVNPYSLDYQVM